MSTRVFVTWLLAALMACAACTRESGDTSEAARIEPPLRPYQGNLLPADGLTPRPGSINATYLGSSMLLFDDGETQLLIDPLLTRPVGDTRPPTTTPDQARIDEALKRIRAVRLKGIFVAGSDERVRDAAYIARKTGATLFASDQLLEIGRADGVPEHLLVSYWPGTIARVGKFRVEEFASKATPPPQGNPANARSRSVGSSADFLIRQDGRSMLVKTSANFIPDALEHANADVLFLATQSLASQSDFFRDVYYKQTVGQVHPALVIPVQWDDTTQPLSGDLAPAPDTPAAFDFLISRLRTDRIRFGLLQGYHTTELFDGNPAIPTTVQ